MLTWKHSNLIIAVVMGVAVVGVGILLLWTQIFGFVSTGTHFQYESTFFHDDRVDTVNIEVGEEDWNNLLENAIQKEYIPCTITLNGTTLSNVGIRAKGNTSLTQVANDSTTDRYSFKVEFDHYITGQSYLGLDKLALNNIISDATYMKEYLSYQVMEEMGIAVPLYGFVNITVNGEPWGVYLAVECLEESYAQRNFGSEYGELYKPESQEAGEAPGQPEDMPNGEAPLMQPDTGETQSTSSSSTSSSQSTGGNAPLGGQSDPGKSESPDSSSGSSSSTDYRQTAEGNPLPDMQQDGEGNRQMGGRRGGFGGGMDSTSGGSALVYTDDSLTSYADIFDNSVFSSTDADQARVVTALKHLHEGTDLERYLDVDEVLRYFAANTVLVNLDSYVGQNKHNYYLYESGGQLSILPWDFNLAFGGFLSGDATAAVNHPIDTPVSSGIEMEDRPLIGKLLEVDEYKEKYHQYLQEIVTNYFDSGKFEATISKLDAMLSSYIKNDATAFYTYEEYEAAIEELKKFGALRAESIQGQLNGSIPSTWEGQQVDDSAFIDASSVNLQAMGSMGGGMGQMGGPGEPGEHGAPAQTEGGQAMADAQSAGSKDTPSLTVNGEVPSNGEEKTTEKAQRDSSSQTEEAAQNPQENNGKNRGGFGGLNLDLDEETLQQAMEILRSSTAQNLIDEQKEQLTALGLTEDQLTAVENMLSQFQTIGGVGKGNGPGAQNATKSTRTAVSTQAWEIIGICFGCMLLGLFLVILFRRRRYK